MLRPRVDAPHLPHRGSVPAAAATQAAIVAALREPRAFGAECAAVRVVETHISYVFLTGQHAFKLKKAVRLPFLDYTSLAARRASCDAELRLNRRTAPQLYLDVVPIARENGGYAVGGGGEVVDWAVRMREFAQDALLSRMLEQGTLHAAHVDELAGVVARFHGEAARADPASPWGLPDDALALALANLQELEPLVPDARERAQVAALREWTQREYAACAGLMAQRRADGFVRECHGDLHLGNVALVDGRPTPFDGIEFNARMRWSDVIADIAFTTMDLFERGRPDLARRFLNGYLELTGDYGGVPLLRLELVYRAAVRAKVAWLRALPAGSGGPGLAATAEAGRYLDLAVAFAQRPQPVVAVMHGPSGSGKTTWSQALLEAVDLIRIRTDVERKRLFGLPAAARTGAAVASGLYAGAVSRQVYGRVRDLAHAIVSAGYGVLVDGACLSRWQRDLFAGLAGTLGAPFVIVALAAPPGVLRERVLRRSIAGSDASEADLAVLDHQLRTHEPLAADELPFACAADGAAPVAAFRDTPRWGELCERLGGAGTPPAVSGEAVFSLPGVAEAARKVAFLRQPGHYRDNTAHVDVVETHRSWVFLTDRHAWKLRKAVRTGDFDYTDVAARERASRAEVVLNARFSNGLYLGVVPLTRNAGGGYALGGPGPAVDWLVQMRRLPADRMLDQLIRNGAVTPGTVSAIVAAVGSYARQAPRAPFGGDQYRSRLAAAIATTRDALLHPAHGLPVPLVRAVAARQRRFLDRAAARFDARVRHGHVIEGHGDLRPEHICVEPALQIIDCLEFSRDLRLLDVADELGFLALECERLGAGALREALFAHYGEAFGDFPDTDLVHFHQSCRALVRALLAIRHRQDPGASERARWAGAARLYLRLAREHIARAG